MSVLVLPRPNFVYAMQALNESRFNNEVRFGYSVCIGAFHGNYRYNEKAFVDLINSWQWLNRMSYFARYKTETFVSADPVRYTDAGFKKTDFYQLLRCLMTLEYNIEWDTIQEAFDNKQPNIPEAQYAYWHEHKHDDLERAFKDLKIIIEELKNGAINEIEAFKNAKYYLPY